MFHLQHLDHVALTVRDLQFSIAWYKDVLGLEQRYQDVWENSPAMLCAGDTCLALFAAHTSEPATGPDPDTTLIMKHLAFRVDRENFEKAQVSLRERQIPLTFEDHTISHSIYFHDPSGYRLEITTWEL
jgi:catechol-2,3-dioxygenase